MVTKMTKSIWIGSLALIASIFLTACSEESPFSRAEENLEDMKSNVKSDYDDEDDMKNDSNSDYDDEDDMRNDTNSDYDDEDDMRNDTNSDYDDENDMSEKYSSSSYRSSSSFRSSSSYRQSSGSTKTDYLSEYDYLTTSMTMNFTLTYYRQTVCSMEGKGSKSCNYDDGDPKISFKLVFVKSTGDSTTYSTSDKLGKKWFYYDNTGEWDGRKSFTVNVPAYTEIIRVCPTVLDDDFSFDDDMSSGYCYYIRDVGLLGYREVVYQSDYANDNCELEWEWYLE